jgi:protein-tyrosine phosphatase
MSTGSGDFDAVLNFRDVGEFINSQGDVRTPRLRVGKLFRSARLDEATEADRQHIANAIGIKTVVDLRSQTEHINAAKKYNDSNAVGESPAVRPSNDQPGSSLKIAGLDYAEINLNGKGFERALVWQLSYMNLARLIFNMALGELPNVSSPPS